MNRDALLELAERIEGNAWMMRRFLHDPSIPDHMVALEVLGRLNIIEAKVAQVRGEMAREESGRPESNVHVLGDRPAAKTTTLTVTCAGCGGDITSGPQWGDAFVGCPKCDTTVKGDAA